MEVSNLAVVTADLLTKRKSWLAVLCRKHGVSPSHVQVKNWVNEWVGGTQAQFRSFLEAKILEMKEEKQTQAPAPARGQRPWAPSLAINGLVRAKTPKY
jgi:hypothetical protein